MDFELTTDQRELQKAAIEFARGMQQGIRERDAAASFSRELWRKCADFGVQGLPVPEDYGGSGLDAISTAAVMEGLGYGGLDQGLLFSINAHLWTNSIPLLRYGSEEQKRRYLPGLCDGSLIGANGASEPDAGSDVFSMRTRARKSDDGYILSGAKTWVTNAPVADVFTVYATLDPGLGTMGICAFVIDKGTAGLQVGQKMDKMGLRTSPMAELAFDDCAIPATALLGREGRGAEVFNCSMAWERSCILAACLGTMQRQLERCLEHARTRRQFGQPIGKFQSVANRLVDMKLRLDTSRLMIYRVAWLLSQDRSADLDAAMTKLHVSEAFIASSLDAVQIHGATGYMAEVGLERELRDAIGSTLYSGTSEIQRNIIARGLRL